jgi:hypothetical protein
MTMPPSIAGFQCCRQGFRIAIRALFLALSLVAYGSVPSTTFAPSEVESEVQEEAASSASIQCDLRRGLRQIAIRRGNVAAFAKGSPALRARQLDASPHVSAGLIVPLRC